MKDMGLPGMPERSELQVDKESGKGFFESILSDVKGVAGGIANMIGSTANAISKIGSKIANIAGEVFESAGNLAKNGVWETDQDRGVRLYTEATTPMSINAYLEFGEAVGSHGYRTDKEAFEDAAMFNRGMLNLTGAEIDQNLTIDQLTNNDLMGQYTSSEYFEKMTVFMEDINEGTKTLELDQGLAEARDLLSNKANILQNQLNNPGLTDTQRSDLQNRIDMNQAMITDINQREEGVKKIQETIEDSSNVSQLAKKTISLTCNVQSYWVYGLATNKDNRSLFQFYQDELQKGNIGLSRDNKGNVTNVNTYTGSGSSAWEKAYDMQRFVKSNGDNGFYNATENVYNDNSKSMLDILNDSDKNHAIVWMNTKNDERKDNKQGYHFFVIQRDGKSNNWKAYDHTSGRRYNVRMDNERYWERIYGIRY